MSQASLEKLVDRYQNDAAFRQEMSADIDGAVHKSGLDLSAEEIASLRNMIGSAGGELRPRVSKRKL